MTVVEYQRRFMELSKYATLLIANEADRYRRFEGGLRKDIRVAVTGGDYKDFGKLVEAALRSTSSQKNRRGFWPGVANTDSFKTKSRGGQSSGSSRGSVQQSAHRHSHAQDSFQSPSQRLVASTQGGSSS
ncbi:CCHC-type domain-containing protein [Abeliophyllum distichum]|uniref:CCHC-type domain-containing protein n=1 Tax=Abeliophyllum distichum TaxID=126358 RepID=A0ABD1QFF5_9LAMI